MEQTSIQLELDTLLNSAYPITPFTPGTSSDNIEDVQENVNSLLLRKRHDDYDLQGVQAVYKPSKVQESTSVGRTVVVKGEDVGDIPTQYSVQGLQVDELPVIGTYVHPSIGPGFRYRVRVLGDKPRVLFSNRTLYLQSVGRGIGKRITFEGETHNYNSNYFYSDSSEEGFAFSLVAVKAGDVFVVCDEEGYAMGEGSVRETSFQKEAQLQVEPDGTLIKHVNVTFTCDVKYGTGKHGLMPLCALETLELSGTAVVIKPKRAQKAFTRDVTNIILPNYGPCVLKFASK